MQKKDYREKLFDRDMYDAADGVKWKKTQMKYSRMGLAMKILSHNAIRQTIVNLNDINMFIQFAMM